MPTVGQNGIQVGANLTYSGNWSTGTPGFSASTLQPSDVIAMVSQTLAASGIVVTASTVTNAPSLTSTLVDGVISLGDSSQVFTVTLQLNIQSGLGFANYQDLISVIENALYQAVGVFGSSDSIPFDQEPGATAQSTGMGVAASPGNTPTLSNGATLTIGLVAVAILAGIVLLAQAKKTTGL